MDEQVRNISQFFFLLFGLSYKNFPLSSNGVKYRLAFFLFHLFLLTFFISFAVERIHGNSVVEVEESYVKQFIQFIIISTSFVILIQSWACGNCEFEIEKKAFEVNKIISEEILMKFRQPDRFPCLRFFAAMTKTFLPIFICFSLAIVPLFCDKVFGIWEILLYSIFIILFASFHYVSSVWKIHEGLSSITEVIRNVLRTSNNSELFTKNFKFLVETRTRNHNLEAKVVKLLKCHNLISSMLSLFNQRFGLSVFLIVFSCFSTITYCGFNFFIELQTTQLKYIIAGEFRQ